MFQSSRPKTRKLLPQIPLMPDHFLSIKIKTIDRVGSLKVCFILYNQNLCYRGISIGFDVFVYFSHLSICDIIEHKVYATVVINQTSHPMLEYDHIMACFWIYITIY